MNASSVQSLLAAVLEQRYAVDVVVVAKDRAEVRLSPAGGAQSSIVLYAETWDPDAALHRQPDVNHLWVVNYTLSSVAEPLRMREQSFVDLGRGIVYLNLPEVLIDRALNSAHGPAVARAALRPTQQTPTRPLIDPFADRASLLTRVLLESPNTTWTVTGLAEAAGVAPMLSSHIVRQLAAEEIVRTEKAGRKLLVTLIEPRRLMEAWTARYNWRRNSALAVAAPVGDDERFLRRFADLMGERRWALTLLAGAWRRTHYAPADRLHAYVEVPDDAALKQLAKELGWAPEPAGRLVLLRPAYRGSAWHAVQPVKEVPVVSDLQLIVDLWHYPERGRETAEQMFGRVEQRFNRTNRLPLPRHGL
jgi:hypothetical protein